ncbi:MAG TPA: Smr/MutS family protein, partial [Gemmatimonadales bacterium]|nr:Smr/MutS family protein [Gemmatimonadales bacterium]
RRREKEAERKAREQARAFLLEARQRVEEAVARAREATDEAAARAARKLVEEGISALARTDRQTAGRPDGQTAGRPDGQTAGECPVVGSRVRVGTGAVGEVIEARPDGRLVVLAGSLRMVVDPASVAAIGGSDDQAAKRVGGWGDRESQPAVRPSGGRTVPLEIDLRGMTGDEAEAATVAAVDAAVLAEHPYLRIIHGMGTGVVRERVHRVVRNDRRIAKYGLAPRNQGGAGVTIVEFAG